jgi:hypothetical protein
MLKMLSAKISKVANFISDTMEFIEPPAERTQVEPQHVPRHVLLARFYGATTLIQELGASLDKWRFACILSVGFNIYITIAFILYLRSV